MPFACNLHRLHTRDAGKLQGMQRLSHPTAPLLLALMLLQACGGGADEPSPQAAVAPSSSASPSPAASTDPAAPSAAPAADITCGLANFEADALRIVNQYRATGATCGARGSFAPAGALSLNARLTSAAYGHSRDMADNDYFSHDSRDGRTMADRVDASGYAWTTIGENIAAGYDSVQRVVDGWMASDGHCANLMNPRFSEFGLACARNAASTYRIYWTQDLGRP
jgi:uncharacterized protein YkwD